MFVCRSAVIPTVPRSKSVIYTYKLSYYFCKYFILYICINPSSHIPSYKALSTYSILMCISNIEKSSLKIPGGQI